RSARMLGTAASFASTSTRFQTSKYQKRCASFNQCYFMEWTRKPTTLRSISGAEKFAADANMKTRYTSLRWPFVAASTNWEFNLGHDVRPRLGLPPTTSLRPDRWYSLPNPRTI